MRSRRDNARTAPVGGAALFIAFGYLLWFAHFSFAYGATTLACVVWDSEMAADIAVVCVTTAALVLAACYHFGATRLATLLGLPAETIAREDLLRTGRIVVLLGVIAILWTGAANTFVEACTPGR